MSSMLESLGDLDETLRNRSGDERLAILRAITDLYLGNADRVSNAATELFDELLLRLVADIEARALAELSVRIAPVATAPAGIVRHLANDDEIHVAGPVLQHSDRLGTGDLLAVASTKGQLHLAAIASRSSVEEEVSDVLVQRGDTGVAITVAGNAGARFSEAGFSILAARAEQEEGIAELIASRPEITRTQLHTLVQRATTTIRNRLHARIAPEARAKLDAVLTDIATDIDKAKAEPPKRDYTAAQEFVLSMPDDPALMRSTLCEFARSGVVEHSLALLSRLSGLPIPSIERILVNSDHGGALILTRAVDLDWPTAGTVLSLRAELGRPRFVPFEAAALQFRSLNAATSQRVLRFWQLRAAVDNAKPVAATAGTTG